MGIDFSNVARENDESRNDRPSGPPTLKVIYQGAWAPGNSEGGAFSDQNPLESRNERIWLGATRRKRNPEEGPAAITQPGN
jgi:hypothetical protein